MYLMNFVQVFQLKGMVLAPVVSSNVWMESAFMEINTVMAIQTAKIILMNLTVVRYFPAFHNAAERI
jgi:hypothetical protein